MAQRKDIAVLLTNQSTSKSLHEGVGNPQAYGGNVVSYLSTYIIHLQRTSNRNRFPGITATLAHACGKQNVSVANHRWWFLRRRLQTH